PIAGCITCRPASGITACSPAGNGITKSIRCCAISCTSTRESVTHPPRHCEEPTGPARLGRPDDRLRDEAIQTVPAEKVWIASLPATRKGASPDCYLAKLAQRA